MSMLSMKSSVSNALLKRRPLGTESIGLLAAVMRPRICPVPGVSISNGLDWSLDGRTMYYIDTPLRSVDVFDFDFPVEFLRDLDVALVRRRQDV